MRVKITMDGIGGCIFRPVNERRVRQFHADMRANGCASDLCHMTLYLGHNDMIEMLTKEKFADLKKGYTVSINIDDWTVRQYFGYCDN